MYDLVITNGKLVTPDRIYEADIAVKDGSTLPFLPGVAGGCKRSDRCKGMLHISGNH